MNSENSDQTAFCSYTPNSSAVKIPGMLKSSLESKYLGYYSPVCIRRGVSNKRGGHFLIKGGLTNQKYYKRGP